MTSAIEPRSACAGPQPVPSARLPGVELCRPSSCACNPCRGRRWTVFGSRRWTIPGSGPRISCHETIRSWMAPPTISMNTTPRIPEVPHRPFLCMKPQAGLQNGHPTGATGPGTQVGEMAPPDRTVELDLRPARHLATNCAPSRPTTASIARMKSSSRTSRRTVGARSDPPMAALATSMSATLPTTRPTRTFETHLSRLADRSRASKTDSKSCRQFDRAIAERDPGLVVSNPAIRPVLAGKRLEDREFCPGLDVDPGRVL